MHSSPQPEPLVSIIIPVFNLWDYTLRCLMSLVKHTSHIRHEVIVVDDASTDESREGLPLLEGIRLIRNEKNQGYSHNNNKAAQVARGKYLVFLNNDTEVHARWLDEMLAVIEPAASVGMVGSKLLFPDGTLQHGGVAFSYGAFEPISPFHIHYKKPAALSQQRLELNAVTAACALMPRDLFLSLGGFDEGFRMGYEDVDLCLRVRASGYRIVYTPLSVVTHYESLSPGRFVASRRNSELLHKKWLGRLDVFESDYRSFPLPPRPASPREGCTVVVATHDDLATIAPCLHNLWLDLGPNDELVIVDDGSVGATADFLQLFLQGHPERCQLLRHPCHQGLAAAWRSGLEAGTKPYAVAVVCTMRVLTGWLDRLIGALGGNARVGLLWGSLADGTQQTQAPVSAAQGGLTIPDRAADEAIQPEDMLTSPVVAATRERMLQLVNAYPAGVPGGHPRQWVTAVHDMGLLTASTTDCVAYRMNQMFPSSNREARDIYFNQISVTLDDPTVKTGLVSIVLVARDFHHAAIATVSAILSNTRQPFELIVVDDGGEGPLREPLATSISASHPTLLGALSFVRNDVPRGFPAAINQGLAQAKGDAVVVMNGDVVVTSGWLVRMMALMQVNDGIGIVAPVANVGPIPQSCEMPNSLEPPMPVESFAADRAAKYMGEFGAMPRVSGICMLIKRALIDAIGGFDSRYEDAGGDVEDFCLRAGRAGFVIAVAREVYVQHLGCLSQRWLELHPRRAAPAGWLRFCARWNHPPHWSDTDGLAKVFSCGAVLNRDTDRIPLPAASAPQRSISAITVTQPSF